MNVTAFRQLSAIVLAGVFNGPNYSFNATVMCRAKTQRPVRRVNSSVSALSKYACSSMRIIVTAITLALAACATEHPREQLVSEAAKVVQRQLDAYNAHDLQAFIATYSDGVMVYRVPETSATISGKKKLSEFYRDSRFNLPKLHAELLHRSVVGSKVIDHERISGLRAEPVEAVAAYVVRDGLIQGVWLFYAE